MYTAARALCYSPQQLVQTQPAPPLRLSRLPPSSTPSPHMSNKPKRQLLLPPSLLLAHMHGLSMFGESCVSVRNMKGVMHKDQNIVDQNIHSNLSPPPCLRSSFSECLGVTSQRALLVPAPLCNSIIHLN